MAKGKRKKSRVPAPAERKPSQDAAPDQLAMDPPKKNLPVLIVLIIAFGIWLTYLVYQAVQQS